MNLILIGAIVLCLVLKIGSDIHQRSNPHSVARLISGITVALPLAWVSMTFIWTAAHAMVGYEAVWKGGLFFPTRYPLHPDSRGVVEFMMGVASVIAVWLTCVFLGSALKAGRYLLPTLVSSVRARFQLSIRN